MNNLVGFLGYMLLNIKVATKISAFFLNATREEQKKKNFYLSKVNKI
jgi:hypothetical protein